MSDSAGDAKIEDVLSSVKRLVSHSGRRPPKLSDGAVGRLVLMPSQRIIPFAEGSPKDASETENAEAATAEDAPVDLGSQLNAVLSLRGAPSPSDDDTPSDVAVEQEPPVDQEEPQLSGDGPTEEVAAAPQDADDETPEVAEETESDPVEPQDIVFDEDPVGMDETVDVDPEEQVAADTPDEVEAVAFVPDDADAESPTTADTDGPLSLGEEDAAPATPSAKIWPGAEVVEDGDDPTASAAEPAAAQDTGTAPDAETEAEGAEAADTDDAPESQGDGQLPDLDFSAPDVDEDAEPQRPIFAPSQGGTSLESKIAALEAAIDGYPQDWEPDGSEPRDAAESDDPRTESLEAVPPVSFRHNHFPAPASTRVAAPREAPPRRLVPDPAPVKPQRVQVRAKGDDDTVASALADEIETLADDTDAPVIDEAVLRELVSEIVRQELQGPLGERITRNVRKLVRREIHRVLASQDFS